MTTTNTTRRAVMAGLAAAPVAGIPGVTAEADAAEKLMTAEDFAAAEFEPWPADILAECELPNNETWAELSLLHVPTIRCACDVGYE